MKDSCTNVSKRCHRRGKLNKFMRIIICGFIVVQVSMVVVSNAQELSLTSDQGRHRLKRHLHHILRRGKRPQGQHGVDSSKTKTDDSRNRTVDANAGDSRPGATTGGGTDSVVTGGGGMIPGSFGNNAGGTATQWNVDFDKSGQTGNVNYGSDPSFGSVGSPSTQFSQSGTWTYQQTPQMSQGAGQANVGWSATGSSRGMETRGETTSGATGISSSQGYGGGSVYATNYGLGNSYAQSQEVASNGGNGMSAGRGYAQYDLRQNPNNNGGGITFSQNSRSGRTFEAENRQYNQNPSGVNGENSTETSNQYFGKTVGMHLAGNGYNSASQNSQSGSNDGGTYSIAVTKADGTQELQSGSWQGRRPHIYVNVNIGRETGNEREVTVDMAGTSAQTDRANARVEGFYGNPSQIQNNNGATQSEMTNINSQNSEFSGERPSRSLSGNNNNNPNTYHSNDGGFPHRISNTNSNEYLRPVNFSGFTTGNPTLPGTLLPSYQQQYSTGTIYMPSGQVNTASSTNTMQTGRSDSAQVSQNNGNLSLRPGFSEQEASAYDQRPHISGGNVLPIKNGSIRPSFNSSGNIPRPSNFGSIPHFNQPNANIPNTGWTGSFPSLSPQMGVNSRPQRPSTPIAGMPSTIPQHASSSTGNRPSGGASMPSHTGAPTNIQMTNVFPQQRPPQVPGPSRPNFSHNGFSVNSNVQQPSNIGTSQSGQIGVSVLQSDSHQTNLRPPFSAPSSHSFATPQSSNTGGALGINLQPGKPINIPQSGVYNKPTGTYRPGNEENFHETSGFGVVQQTGLFGTNLPGSSSQSTNAQTQPPLPGSLINGGSVVNLPGNLPSRPSFSSHAFGGSVSPPSNLGALPAGAPHSPASIGGLPQISAKPPNLGSYGGLLNGATNTANSAPGFAAASGQIFGGGALSSGAGYEQSVPRPPNGLVPSLQIPSVGMNPPQGGMFLSGAQVPGSQVGGSVMAGSSPTFGFQKPQISITSQPTQVTGGNAPNTPNNDQMVTTVGLPSPLGVNGGTTGLSGIFNALKPPTGAGNIVGGTSLNAGLPGLGPQTSGLGGTSQSGGGLSLGTNANGGGGATGGGVIGGCACGNGRLEQGNVESVAADTPYSHHHQHILQHIQHKGEVAKAMIETVGSVIGAVGSASGMTSVNSGNEQSSGSGGLLGSILG